MKPQLSCEIVWKDEHLIEIEFKASNAKYAGSTTVYSSGEELIALGKKLLGFPKNIEHKEAYEFGDVEGYSFVSLKFKCFDRAGHTGVEVILHDNKRRIPRKEARSRIYREMLFEPGQIDTFSQQLVRIGETEHGIAILPGLSI